MAGLAAASFYPNHNNPTKFSKVMHKILLVTHYYPAHRGGIEIVAGKLAEYFLKEGKTEIVWTASDTDPPPMQRAHLRCLPMKTFNFFENSLSIPYPIWSLRSIKVLWQETKEADLIHIHDCLYIGNVATFFFARLMRKPVLITQHTGFTSFKNLFLRAILSILNRTFGSYLLGKAEQVVFVSDHVRGYFTRFVHFKQPPLSIANGLDSSIFFPVDEKRRNELRNKLGLETRGAIFLFVGRFVEKKGLPILRKLAKYFDSVQWIFVGWGQMDPAAWNLGNVRVFKDLENSQVAKFYQVADLLVLPSFGEGFPLVVQESMACGTPALVSPEVAASYPAGKHLMLSEPVNGGNVVERWSSRIETIMKDMTMLGQMRRPVSEFAQYHWSWNSCGDAYWGVFKKLFSSAAASGVRDSEKTASCFEDRKDEAS